jgi:hypothetical protein
MAGAETGAGRDRERSHLDAARLEPFPKPSRPRVLRVEAADERDPHEPLPRRGSPFTSFSQRRAYFVKTENAASMQRTMP